MFACGIESCQISAPKPLSSQRCETSVDRPSLRSIMEVAIRFSPRARPTSILGSGKKCLGKSFGLNRFPDRKSASAAAELPSWPETKIRSPGRAPDRRTGVPHFSPVLREVGECRTDPRTTISANTPAGDSAVSPPARGTLKRFARNRNPFKNPSTQLCGSFAGNAKDRKAAMGSPPMAAMSLSPRARQRCPTDSGGCQSRRKCTSSRLKSVVQRRSRSFGTRRTEASSPMPTRIEALGSVWGRGRPPLRETCLRKRAISSRSGKGKART